MNLYPSWIEIPVTDLERALAFYRALFDLTNTPIFNDPPATIAVLLPSDKNLGNPGVSLVHSPSHLPSDKGVLINFHLGTHSALQAALTAASRFGGSGETKIVDTGDGVRYATVLDCEGNRLALSPYEPLDDGEQS